MICPTVPQHLAPENRAEQIVLDEPSMKIIPQLHILIWLIRRLKTAADNEFNHPEWNPLAQLGPDNVNICGFGFNAGSPDQRKRHVQAVEKTSTRCTSTVWDYIQVVVDGMGKRVGYVYCKNNCKGVKFHPPRGSTSGLQVHAECKSTEGRPPMLPL